MIVCVCACSGNKTVLPTSAYNLKLGETYTESEMIQTLNKDTFRSFRVWHKGDSFLPGMHDTFYKSEGDSSISYLGYKSNGSTDFSFCDFTWDSFRIEADKSGKIEVLKFAKGTMETTRTVDSITKEHNALISKFHSLYGQSVDSEVDGKRFYVWNDSATSLTVEYWEFTDYKDEPNANLSCELSLLGAEQ